MRDEEEPRRVRDAALDFARACGIDTAKWGVVGMWADDKRVMFDLAQLDMIGQAVGNRAVFPIRQVRLHLADSLPGGGSDEAEAVRDAAEVLEQYRNSLAIRVRDALEAVANEIRAEALREAADWLAQMGDGRTGSYHEAGRHIIARLRDRADRMEKP